MTEGLAPCVDSATWRWSFSITMLFVVALCRWLEDAKALDEPTAAQLSASKVSPSASTVMQAACPLAQLFHLGLPRIQGLFGLLALALNGHGRETVLGPLHARLLLGGGHAVPRVATQNGSDENEAYDRIPIHEMPSPGKLGVTEGRQR
ncbi:MAG: hypothetical protein IPO56_04525 [Flavobacteriales bacterium]|nr:hypothetical protein [Flavobacteriales bacterium]